MPAYPQMPVLDNAPRKRRRSRRRGLALRLMHVPYVRSAVVEKADLSAFAGPPTLRIIAGVLAIVLSFIICWPAITALGVLSAYCEQPWIVAVGGPTLYGLSHVCFIIGMWLSGEKYTRIFLRWATRKGTERLLAVGAGSG